MEMFTKIFFIQLIIVNFIKSVSKYVQIDYTCYSIILL
jgi:hypothetical protein